MTTGKSPYNMSQAPVSGSLEQQHAWPFGVVWIVFNHFCGFRSIDKFPYKQSVSGDLIVSMPRNSDIAFKNQCPDFIKRTTHNTP